MVLPGATVEAAHTTAERIRTAISRVSVTATGMDGQQVQITGLSASVGASVFPDNATELPPLIIAADAAVYTAKRTGRDRTCLAGQG